MIMRLIIWYTYFTNKTLSNYKMYIKVNYLVTFAFIPVLE